MVMSSGSGSGIGMHSPMISTAERLCLLYTEEWKYNEGPAIKLDPFESSEGLTREHTRPSRRLLASAILAEMVLQRRLGIRYDSAKHIPVTDRSGKTVAEVAVIKVEPLDAKPIGDVDGDSVLNMLTSVQVKESLAKGGLPMLHKIVNILARGTSWQKHADKLADKGICERRKRSVLVFGSTTDYVLVDQGLQGRIQTELMDMLGGRGPLDDRTAVLISLFYRRTNAKNAESFKIGNIKCGAEGYRLAASIYGSHKFGQALADAYITAVTEVPPQDTTTSGYM